MAARFVGAAPRSLGEATAIQTLYHEATRAYLDLTETQREVATLIGAGTEHYRGARATGEGITSDPARVFQEAAASYVGHRAARW